MSQSVPTSRRTFLAGATAAGISALAAGAVPRIAAAAEMTEFPQPLTGFKLTCVLRRRSDLSFAEFKDYWLHKHAPLATACVKDMSAYRYVQTHLVDSDFNPLLRTARGQTAPPFDGVTEVWFPSAAALQKALGTRAGVQANARLELDESNFIDLPNCSYFFSAEYLCLGEATPVPCPAAPAATIGAARFTRTRAGSRQMQVILDVHQSCSAAASIIRGRQLLARTSASHVKPGTPILTLPLSDGIPAGAATVKVTLTDAAGAKTVLRRTVHVPELGGR
jgi:hypothetical protein